MRRFAASGILLIALSWAAGALAQGEPSNACGLLSSATIAKATGLHVGEGKQGPAIANALSGCTWAGEDGTKIIVTVADAAPMQVTMQAQLEAGATEYEGIGQSAVGTAGTDETEGGYNMSILDAKGGVAVSILGSAGTGERTVALAKAIEALR